MCKSLLYRQLLYTGLLFVVTFHLSYGQQEMMKSRSLDTEDLMREHLFHQALFSMDPYQDLTTKFLQDRQQIIALLNTRYPELTYELERTPKQALEGKEISSLMVQLLKEETSAGVVNTDNSFWHITDQSDMSKQDRSIFKFLYAYELFKQKRFDEADKLFNKIIQNRKGEYEHAFYYSGLVALINKEYQEAADKLKLVGKNEQLRKQTPYYLAAAHYGNKDFPTIIKYYEPRLNEPDLHNAQGLMKLVAYAQFNNADFEDAITTLSMLEKVRPLTSEENYVMGIAFQKTGKKQLSSEYFTDVSETNTNLTYKAQYENAINLATANKNAEAIKAFEILLHVEEFDKNEIIWNLAVLNSREGKLDKMAFHASQLLETNKKEKAIELIIGVLDNLENDQLYQSLVTQLYPKIEDKSLLKTSVYGRAMIALKSTDKSKADQYFNLLSDIDPLVEERGAVAAWRGIMAYEEGEYPRAIRLFSNYLASRPINSQFNKLDFDVEYFLAYSNFKTKNHSSALGHFSKALELVLKNPGVLRENPVDTRDDLFLRMGDCYFLLDEYDNAKRSYKRVIDENGKHMDYALWQNSIIAELQNKSYDQIIILDQLINEFPNSKYRDRAIFSTGNALFAINRFDRASKFYENIIHSSAPISLKEESKIQLGLISVNAGDYNRAEKYFKGLIENSEDKDVVHRSHLALQEIYSDYTFDTEAYLDLLAEQNPDRTERDLSKNLFDLAQSNYEKGNYNEAHDQWSKLIEEYPSSSFVGKSHTMLAGLYEQRNDWSKAISHYDLAAKHNSSKERSKALIKSETIAFEELKDYELFLSLRKKRLSLDPKQSLSNEERQRELTAYLFTDRFGPFKSLASEVLEDEETTESFKKRVVQKAADRLSTSRKWSDLNELLAENAISKVVDTKPKLIYQRALAFFNDDRLTRAELAITDYYDNLLGSPAWLAKGIILLSDIYILQDDKDSAEAALEALISSESNIPPSQIEVAKERLKALELQN